MIHFISYPQLIEDTEALARKVPAPVGVLGIPRSGMLPATILATRFHVPLGDVFTFAATGKFFVGGRRMGPPPQGGQVLVVDDSAHGGVSMRMAREALVKLAAPEWLYTYAAVYRHPRSPYTVDYFARDLEPPRYFAWNFMRHPDIQKWMCDIDGIFCVDPPVFDDGGPKYVAALENAQPLQLTHHTVHTLTSCRLEAWRAQTCNWMARHGVRFQNLILCPFATAAERRASIDYGEWKAGHYLASRCELFVESDPRQAETIARVSKRPVLCPALGRVL